MLTYCFYDCIPFPFPFPYGCNESSPNCVSSRIKSEVGGRYVLPRALRATLHVWASSGRIEKDQQGPGSDESSQQVRKLEKTTILAPFDGVIDNVFKEPGTVIAPGQGSEVFRIVNLSNMYISTEVPERYIASITKNKKVKIAFPVLGLNEHSTIRQVASFINPSNRSFKIEVPVNNKSGNIKPNLTARLQINDYTNSNAILIPQSIISENANGEQFIYVVKNKKANKEAIAERVVIKTGKTQGDVIEVLANLAVGTEIIQEGARSVNNGQTVRVINK